MATQHHYLITRFKPSGKVASGPHKRVQAWSAGHLFRKEACAMALALGRSPGQGIMTDATAGLLGVMDKGEEVATVRLGGAHVLLERVVA